MDIVFVGAIVLFFGLLVGLMKVCEKLECSK